MKSPPLVRTAMLVSLLALSAAGFGNRSSLDSLLGRGVEERLAQVLSQTGMDTLLSALQREECQIPPTLCETQPSPQPPTQALYQKPAVTTCAKSCKQLRDQGGSQPNGVYWFSGMSVPTLCDFSLDGGGWTLLLVATTTDGWGPLSVHGRNEYSPSLTDNYSILKLADAIRDLASGGRFNYRIEAQAQKGRQHWGGVWDVPRDYSFVAESPSQNDVNIVRKFDTWSYSDDGIEQRMPWLYAGSGVPVLTMSEFPERDWWGTLVSRESHNRFQHSPWINPEAENSGTVLYWVRE